jgi:hypothetical protein
MASLNHFDTQVLPPVAGQSRPPFQRQKQAGPRRGHAPQIWCALRNDRVAWHPRPECRPGAKKS